MSNYKKLIDDIANKSGADYGVVDDLIFAISTAERHFGKSLDGGSNGQNKLNFKSVLVSGYGLPRETNLDGVSPLSDIQEKRLVCDLCYMLTKGKVEGTKLTMPTSAKLIKNMHSDFSYETDVKVCDKYIKLYQDSVSDYDKYFKLKKYFDEYRDAIANKEICLSALYDNYQLVLPRCLGADLMSYKYVFGDIKFVENYAFKDYATNLLSKNFNINSDNDLIDAYNIYILNFMYFSCLQGYVDKLFENFKANRTNFAVRCLKTRELLRKSSMSMSNRLTTCSIFNLPIYQLTSDFRLYNQYINSLIDVTKTVSTEDKFATYNEDFYKASLDLLLEARRIK